MVLKSFVYNLIIILVFLSNSFGYSQQFSSIDFINNSDFDKVVISHYTIRDKTFHPPPQQSELFSLDTLTVKKESDTIGIVSEIHVRMGQAELTKNEVRKIITKLKQQLIPNYAMDTNKNIVIDFYRKDSIFQNITISPNTKNIYVTMEGCGNVIDVEGNEYNPCIYRGQMNLGFERYIYCLLKKKKLLK